MREQAVASGQVHDPPAAEQPPHTARDLPGLVQLLARQAPGTADRACQPFEQGLTREAAQIVFGQPSPGAMREPSRGRRLRILQIVRLAVNRQWPPPTPLLYLREGATTDGTGAPAHGHR